MALCSVCWEKESGGWHTDTDMVAQASGAVDRNELVVCTYLCTVVSSGQESVVVKVTRLTSRFLAR
jgi:hypothetical protein